MGDQQTAESVVARRECGPESLPKKTLPASVRDEVDETDSRIDGLPVALAQLRSCGYQFHNYLGARTERWQSTGRPAASSKGEAQLPGSASLHYILAPAVSASACRALSVIAKTVSVATVSAMAVS